MTNDPVTYLRVWPGEPLPSIERFRHFRAVLIAEGPSQPEFRDQIGRWLVDAGCLYAMAWGADSEAWHDAVDWANIDAYSPGEVPDEGHVMTTWHNDETLESVLWFAQFCAHEPYDRIGNTLLIHLSPSDQQAQVLDNFVRSQTLAEREPD